LFQVDTRRRLECRAFASDNGTRLLHNAAETEKEHDRNGSLNFRHRSLVGIGSSSAHALSAERIYLFASRARDEADEDSDFDSLVVVGDSVLSRYKREQLAFRALCGIGIAKDVLVYTKGEFDRGLTVLSSLPSTVAREGRLLYAG
jgi:predicted nucleotidyltransferase